MGNHVKCKTSHRLQYTCNYDRLNYSYKGGAPGVSINIDKKDSKYDETYEQSDNEWNGEEHHGPADTFEDTPLWLISL